MSLGLFVFLAVLSIISSLGVIAQRNPVHCLLALILTLIAVGAMFIALDAVTVGLLQIIVYVGAIMILFLFVIWLLDTGAQAVPIGHLALKFFAAIAAAALVAELFVFLTKMPSELSSPALTPGYGSIDRLASTLFGTYLIAFEVTSILLLVAVVGAVAVARRSGPERLPPSGGVPRTGAVS